jgi:rhodanese-related sulfurtransferase
MNVFPRILLEAAAIAALGAAIGLSVNHRLVFDAFEGRLTAPVKVASEAQSRVPQPVLLAEVRELAATGALLVDARDSALYADGHLAGAFSLPLGEVESRLTEFRQRVDPAKTLVIYCNGYGCPDSFDLGLRLIAEGYRDVRVFEGGFPEWRDAGLSIDKGGK